MNETTFNLIYVGFFLYFLAVCLTLRWAGKAEVEEAPRRVLAAQWIPEDGEPGPMVYFDKEPTFGEIVAATQPAKSQTTTPPIQS